MSFSDSIICPQCQERAPVDYVLCPYCGYSLVKLVRERTRIPVGFTQAIDRIRRLISDPMHTHETMREISANPDRKGGLLVSFLISFFLLEMAAIAFASDYLGNPLFALIIMIVFPLLGSFVWIFVIYLIWWAFGLATWLLARLVGGKGTRRDTSGIVGYAMLPLVPALLISDLFVFLLDNTDFAAIVMLPFLVWSIYLAGLGIQHVHSLDRTFSNGISAFLVAVFYAAFMMNLI